MSRSLKVAPGHTTSYQSAIVTVAIYLVSFSSY